MRILAVTNLYPPHSFGGYEDLCAGAVRDWRDAGHDVRVLASDWRRPDVPADAPSPAGEPVARVLPLYWDDHREFDVPWPRALGEERRARRAAARALDRLRPDVVSVWNAAGLSFSLFDEVVARDLPVVLVLGDRWLEFGPAADAWRAHFLGDGGSIAARLLAAALRMPTATGRLGAPAVATFASAHLREHAERTTTWDLADRVVVPHGLDLSRVGASAPPGRAWRGRLLFVGRLVPEKGVEVAIRAVAAVRGARLDVVGTGPTGYRRRLEDVVAELDVADRVTLVGEEGGDRLRRRWADADALLFPSQWPEPFGIVPLEAMAAGLPVVATGTGGSGEFLVDELTCLRVAPRDVAATAGAIQRLGQDTDLRDRLRSAGLEIAAWLDRRHTYADLLAWHDWARGGCVGPRPPVRPTLPKGLSQLAPPEPR